MRLSPLLLLGWPLVQGATTKTLVNVRIEGAQKTIFEGQVLTSPKNVTTASGGTHLCNGQNNGANPTPGPTCTTALSDAARHGGFTWDGTFLDQFDDFFVMAIGGDAQTTTQFWGTLLDFQFNHVSGCEQEVLAGQEVLWAFDAFNANNFLKISGPGRVKARRPVVVTVVNGMNGQPVAGARIASSLLVGGGNTTDAAGMATLTFSRPGSVVLKAERADSIRSNGLTVHAA